MRYNYQRYLDICILYIGTVDLCNLFSKLKLPSEDASLAYVDVTREHEVPTRASTRMSRVSVKLPETSVAGVKGEQAEKFEVYKDGKTRVRPVAHCWLPSGDILIGCKGGQLLKVRNLRSLFRNDFFFVFYRLGT